MIKVPVITAKTVQNLKFNKYTFSVSKNLKKPQIKSLIEELFSVKVVGINSLIFPVKKRSFGKFTGFKSSEKRVFIKLEKNDLIPYFTSL